MNKRTALYRLYDADDALLYVGISSRPKSRWADHRRKPWGARIHRASVEWLDVGFTEAHQYEADVIRRERPVYNIKGADLLAVQDAATGEISFVVNTAIPEAQCASVTSRITKAERDGAMGNLPDGQALGRYVRACIRALQNEPERAMDLAREYWPPDPALRPNVRTPEARSRKGTAD